MPPMAGKGKGGRGMMRGNGPPTTSEHIPSFTVAADHAHAEEDAAAAFTFTSASDGALSELAMERARTTPMYDGWDRRLFSEIPYAFDGTPELDSAILALIAGGGVGELGRATIRFATVADVDALVKVNTVNTHTLPTAAKFAERIQAKNDFFIVVEEPVDDPTARGGTRFEITAFINYYFMYLAPKPGMGHSLAIESESLEDGVCPYAADVRHAAQQRRETMECRLAVPASDEQSNESFRHTLYPQGDCVTCGVEWSNELFFSGDEKRGSRSSVGDALNPLVQELDISDLASEAIVRILMKGFTRSVGTVYANLCDEIEARHDAESIARFRLRPADGSADEELVPSLDVRVLNFEKWSFWMTMPLATLKDEDVSTMSSIVSEETASCRLWSSVEMDSNFRTQALGREVMQHCVLAVLGPEMGKRAHADICRILRKVEGDLGWICLLVFPFHLCGTLLSEETTGCGIPDDAKVVWAGALAYVAAEIIESSGNAARARGGAMIQIADVESAVKSDEELNQVFGAIFDQTRARQLETAAAAAPLTAGGAGVAAAAAEAEPAAPSRPTPALRRVAYVTTVQAVRPVTHPSLLESSTAADGSLIRVAGLVGQQSSMTGVYALDAAHSLTQGSSVFSLVGASGRCYYLYFAISKKRGPSWWISDTVGVAAGYIHASSTAAPGGVVGPSSPIGLEWKVYNNRRRDDPWRLDPRLTVTESGGARLTRYASPRAGTALLALAFAHAKSAGLPFAFLDSTLEAVSYYRKVWAPHGLITVPGRLLREYHPMQMLLPTLDPLAVLTSPGGATKIASTAVAAADEITVCAVVAKMLAWKLHWAVPTDVESLSDLRAALHGVNGHVGHHSETTTPLMMCRIVLAHLKNGTYTRRDYRDFFEEFGDGTSSCEPEQWAMEVNLDVPLQFWEQRGGCDLARIVLFALTGENGATV